MRILHFLLLTLGLIVVSTAQIHASENQKSKIVTPLKIATVKENPPSSMILPDGTPTGLYVEFWQLWSATNNIPITFISTTIAENFKLLKSHQVDFHAGLFANDERRIWADFSIPIHRVKTGIFFHSDTLVTTALSEFKNEKVGVQSSTFQASMLAEKYPNIDIVLFDDAKLMVLALLDKKITALVSETPYLKTELGRMGLSGVLKESPEILTINEVHALIPKGNPELVKLINQGIQKIPLSKLIALEKKWLPEDEPYFQNLASINFPELTLEQQQWLKSHPQLSLGTDPSWPPFEFRNEKNEYVGISSDYINFIKDKLALEMLPKNNLTWVEVMKKAEIGEIDILPAVVKTENREKFFNFTEPYINFPMIIATRKDGFFIQELKDLNTHRVGVVKSYITHELLSRDFPDINLIFFDTVADGLTKLDSGDIDAFVENLGVITYHINQEIFSNIKVAATTPYKLELAIGVRKGLEPLVPILNKVLNAMTEKQKSAIANSWLSYSVNFDEDLSAYLYSAISIGAFLSLIILFVWNSNRRLQFEINERKKIETSLERARSSAVAANKAKDEFLANMSHEIRTPMNAVVGMAHLLGASDLNPEQQNYINALNKSSDSLLVLINDILDLSKIEAGKLFLEKRDFNLKELLEDITQQTQLKITTKKIEISLKFENNLAHMIKGDSLRLSQILHNLLNNALKFTEAGKISISVESYQKFENQHCLKFSISDTGIGLTLQQQGRLFQTYTQADSSITRKYGGTGLGLSICHNLCSLMQGKIWVESVYGKGSTFAFTAIFDNADTTNQHPTENINKDVTATNEELLHSILKDKKVLVVDDNAVNLTIANKVLNNYNMEVHSAINGELAIKALESAAESSPFDIVLMDIQMPVMDGYSATIKIRQNKVFKKLPIIAMSANVMQVDIQKALNSGMNDHIGKPLNIDEMMQILTEHLNT
jgi:signal transduction histidine kinase/ActR/RegA family two-component response regulator